MVLQYFGADLIITVLHYVLPYFKIIYKILIISPLSKFRRVIVLLHLWHLSHLILFLDFTVMVNGMTKKK